MIPDKTHPKWEALVRGEIKPNFKVFSGNMMLHRLSRSVEKNGSNGNVQECIDQAHTFFSRFEQLFIDELNEIFE
ncbi:hypothetical protein JW948_12930 [bacterium]|nr:hypothetical protein [bacterium]